MPEVSSELADIVSGLDADFVSALRADLADVPGMPTTNEGLEAEFFAQAYRFARDWLLEREGPVDGAKPAVFVLSRAIHQDKERLPTKLRPYFCSRPDAACDGQVLIATPDLSQVVELTDVGVNDVDEAAAALQQAGLEACAHVVFRPDRGELILVGEGLLLGSKRVPISLGAPVRLSQLELEHHFWLYHADFTQTPSGYINCWRGAAGNRVPVAELERQISGLLGFYLGTIVGREHVQIEHHTTHGRVDVAVFSAAMQPDVGPCAVEIKVLKSRQWRSSDDSWTSVSDASMTEHASEGVRQAVDYRAKLQGKVAYLCCFDGRFDDSDQPEVVALAAEKNIELRRYYLYESQDAYRAARKAADEAGQLLSGEVLLAG